MILLLVYCSLFFFSLATGNQQLENSVKLATKCENEVCAYQDQQDLNIDVPQVSPMISATPQALPITRPPLRAVEGHYGYPTPSVISANLVHAINPQARIETKSDVEFASDENLSIQGPYGYPSPSLISANPVHAINPQARIETKSDVEFASDENPSIQVIRPDQVIGQGIADDFAQYTEKTTCFTPAIVRKLIKSVLEYVSQMPVDLNKVEEVDQELTRMSDQESIEENNLKKPLYLLDSNGTTLETRSNFLLQYEVPSVKESPCKDVLDRLIEIAYTTYLEIEKHPQCRGYILHKLAMRQPEDRPKVHIDLVPDLKVLIASILEQGDKLNQGVAPNYNHYDDIVSLIHKHDIPRKSHIHEYTITQSHEHNIPHIQNIIIPQVQPKPVPGVAEMVHEEIIPMQPEETTNFIIKLLQNSDHLDNRYLFDRLTNILKENQNNFHPKIFTLLHTLLNTHKHNHIPRFNDIVLLLLDAQKNRDWPWSERVTENLLSHLNPDQTGHLDSKIVDIILNLYKKRPNEKDLEHVLSLLKTLKDGNLDHSMGNVIHKLINSHQKNLLHPDYFEILLKLLKPLQNGIGNPEEIDTIDNLLTWNEMGNNPNQLHKIFTFLKPYVNSNVDHRPIDIIHLLLTQKQHLNPDHIDFILAFLCPENGMPDTRRIDLINFLLNNVLQYPKHVNILLDLLQENPHVVMNSKFLGILHFLNSNRLLTPELIYTILDLIINEVTGQLEDDQVKTLIFQLAPFTQTNPKLVVDVLSLLNQDGLHGNIVEWLKTYDHNIGLPHHDHLKIVLQEIEPDNHNIYRLPNFEYQTVDDGHQTPDNDFLSIFKWLESQGLITQDQGFDTDFVNKLMNILEVGDRESGAIELTYMLKHEKPVIYQPVHYVKYRLPILSFITNMQNLLMMKPHLNNDPMKLLQELIVTSNVTEISPNIQGYPKEEILKLTFSDGDLVQAKLLDEHNLILNDQIKYVHGLNSNISPEEILQLNRMNEAKYFSNLVDVQRMHPDKLMIKEVAIPPVQYRHDQMDSDVMDQMKTIHQTYIARSDKKQNALHNSNP